MGKKPKDNLGEHSPVTLHVSASQHFFNTATFPGFLAACKPEDVSEGPRTLLLAPAANLTSLIAWFREASDADHSARLSFPSSLSKGQRALIHTLVNSVGLGCLDSVSEGIAEERCISVVRCGKTPCQEELTEAQENKAHWLYRWGSASGAAVSRDEVRDMLRHDRLSPELQHVWEVKRAQQKLVISICEAIGSGDTAALQEILRRGQSLTREVLSTGVFDVLLGRGPLQCAAREGNVAALAMLLDAGALDAVDACDGNGLTALQVSRLFPEQCEAEGYLLRSGALDLSEEGFPPHNAAVGERGMESTNIAVSQASLSAEVTTVDQ